MPGAAAIFDLDRTLLRTSSTPALNQALFEQGVARRSSLPGQALLMRFYDVFGETLPSMAMARAAAVAARGLAGQGGGASGPTGRRPAAAAGASLRARPVGDAPGGRTGAGAGHHHPVRHGGPAGRPTRDRRGHRYQVWAGDRQGRRRAVQWSYRGWVRMVGRKAPGGAALGLASAISTCARAGPTRTACTTCRSCRRSAIPRSSTPTSACWRPRSWAGGRSPTWTAPPAYRSCWGWSRWTWCG